MFNFIGIVCQHPFGVRVFLECIFRCLKPYRMLPSPTSLALSFSSWHPTYHRLPDNRLPDPAAWSAFSATPSTSTTFLPFNQPPKAAEKKLPFLRSFSQDHHQLLLPTSRSPLFDFWENSTQPTLPTLSSNSQLPLPHYLSQQYRYRLVSLATFSIRFPSHPSDSSNHS